MGKRKSQAQEAKQNVYTVETICRKKLRNNKEPIYLIKWKDWDEKFNTWEPSSNILDKSLIEQFEDEQKEKVNKEKSGGNNIFESLQDLKTTAKMELEAPATESKVIASTDAENVTERPKICLKISKTRIQSASLTPEKEASEVAEFNYKIEHSRLTTLNASDSSPPDISSSTSPLHHISQHSQHTTKLPSHLKSELKPDKPIKIHSEPSQQSPLSSGKSSLKSLTTALESWKPKPKKLLSINEYSGILKLHKTDSKKPQSTHSKHPPVLSKSHKLHFNRKSLSAPNGHKSISSPIKNDKNNNSIVVKQTPKVLSDDESEENIPTATKSSSLIDENETAVDEEKSKPADTIQQQPPMLLPRNYRNTIITDVNVRGLLVTIREVLIYSDEEEEDDEEEFLSESNCSRLMQIVKVPKSAEFDWLKRFEGRPPDLIAGFDKPKSPVRQLDNTCDDDSDIDVVGGVDCPEEPTNTDDGNTVSNNIFQSLLQSCSTIIMPQLKPAPWLEDPATVIDKQKLITSYLLNYSQNSVIYSPAATPNSVLLNSDLYSSRQKIQLLSIDNQSSHTNDEYVNDESPLYECGDYQPIDLSCNTKL